MIPKTLLLILDGYGLADNSKKNAARLAHTPTLDRLFYENPHMARLDASGESVGLPFGFMGNSEVGHLNIGAGRVVPQDMMRIDDAIANKDFFSNEILLDLFKKVRDANGRLHIMGLLSDGGVHSHINHIKALLQMAKEQNIPTLLHAFTDGRDTSPTSGVQYVQEILPVLKETNNKFASICGRFYAMDRDQRWDRVEKAWNMMVHGNAVQAQDPVQVLNTSYENGQTDEFIQAHILLEPCEACVKDGDGVFCFNFRADRAREIVHAFVDTDFPYFERGAIPKLSAIASMTRYAENLPIASVFPKNIIMHTIGEEVSKRKLPQLRIAETEKYAHVTYFFNGGREAPFDLEDRILIPSPKDVATYDLKPEMSVYEVTEQLLTQWAKNKYAFVVCNLANPDMLGHTGSIEATINACEIIDTCVAKIEKVVLESGGILCITADHGNAEEMLDLHGNPQTAHSMNQTPLILEDSNGFIKLSPQGKLGDIAPTLMKLWGFEIPAQMTATVLIQK